MTNSPLDMRDTLITRLYDLASQDKDIVFLSDDYGAPSLDKYRQKLPKQFINTGVSEQNMISVAAGLSMSGKKVFVYCIASFLSLRCLEQIKIDLCVMRRPVALIGVGTCYAYSTDGPTHHASEDLALMRSMPHMTIYSPSDSNAARMAIDMSSHREGPTYIRLDRGKLPILYDPSHDNFSAGFEVLKEGPDIGIISTGFMTHRAMEVSDKLSKMGIQASVIDLYRIKPVNIKRLLPVLKGRKKLVTLEEHSLHGGLGSLLGEILLDHNLAVPLKRFGIPDESIFAYGERHNLHKARGLDNESIVVAIQDWLKKN